MGTKVEEGERQSLLTEGYEEWKMRHMHGFRPATNMTCKDAEACEDLPITSAQNPPAGNSTSPNIFILPCYYYTLGLHTGHVCRFHCLSLILSWFYKLLLMDGEQKYFLQYLRAPTAVNLVSEKEYRR